MEEIQIADGQDPQPVRSPTTDPTILDMPPMNVDVLELADPHAALRPARCRRATDHLLDTGHRGGDPRGHWAGAEPCPGPAEHITGL